MNYLYLEDFNETLNELIKEDDVKAAAPKLVYYGVKYINNSINEVATIEEAAERIDFIKLVLTLVQQLTPGDLSDLFPIEKKYRYLHYNSSLNFIKEYGLDNFMENPLDFFLYYSNKDIGNFVRSYERSVNNLLKLEGKYETLLSSIEEYNLRFRFTNQFVNESEIGPCRIHRDLEGRAYLINKEGKSIELKRQFPGYLKPVNKEV